MGRNEIKICLGIFLLTIASFYCCAVLEAHSSEWWEVSAKADKLIGDRKYDEAEKMLTGILPVAKAKSPKSLDCSLVLCRLSTALYALKKYPQALARMNEAMEIASQHSPSVSQRKIMWHCMVTKTAILLAMKKNAEAENLARTTVAYVIAFPEAATPNQVKIPYSLLSDALKAQKKVEEAKKISEIMNRQ